MNAQKIKIINKSQPWTIYLYECIHVLDVHNSNIISIIVCDEKAYHILIEFLIEIRY